MKKINNINLKVLKTDPEVNLDMALDMLHEIIKNNAMNRKTVFIVPVGPTGQYPILASVVNKLNISLKNVWFFNMDEYMSTPTEAISPTHFLSFRKRMNDEFYSLVRPDLVMPENQRLFPEPGKEADYDALLESLGGADVCYGGVGINGHIAFNEAAEPSDAISAEEFSNLGSRVLPKWCITIGMKQILASKRIYLSLGAPWHPGILKRILSKEPQPQIPATLLKNHPNVLFCTNESIADSID